MRKKLTECPFLFASLAPDKWKRLQETASTENEALWSSGTLYSRAFLILKVYIRIKKIKIEL